MKRLLQPVHSNCPWTEEELLDAMEMGVTVYREELQKQESSGHIGHRQSYNEDALKRTIGNLAQNPNGAEDFLFEYDQMTSGGSAMDKYKLWPVACGMASAAELLRIPMEVAQPPKEPEACSGGMHPGY